MDSELNLRLLGMLVQSSYLMQTREKYCGQGRLFPVYLAAALYCFGTAAGVGLCADAQRRHDDLAGTARGRMWGVHRRRFADEKNIPQYHVRGTKNAVGFPAAFYFVQRSTFRVVM